MTTAQLTKLFPELEQPLYEELVREGQLKEFREGETILRKGQFIRSAVLLLDGTIKLYQENEDGGEFFMYYIQPGEACAVSMICSHEQETSGVLATAATDATVLLIPLAYMDQWMSRYKTWRQFVIQAYRSRYQELLNTIGEIAFRNMDDRLEFYLRKQVKQFGNIIRLTHQQIADDLNSSREVISRLMKKMENNGWVILHRNSFEWIKDDFNAA